MQPIDRRAGSMSRFFNEPFRTVPWLQLRVNLFRPALGMGDLKVGLTNSSHLKAKLVVHRIHILHPKVVHHLPRIACCCEPWVQVDTARVWWQEGSHLDDNW